jgi:hypothetical protein
MSPRARNTARELTVELQDYDTAAQVIGRVVVNGDEGGSTIATVDDDHDERTDCGASGPILAGRRKLLDLPKVLVQLQDAGVNSLGDVDWP